MTYTLARPLTSTAGADFPTPAPNFALMRILGTVNRWVILRGYLRVRRVDLPRADRERLRMAVNESTAAFLAPNHPEFGVDWMIDKELSTIAAPRVASWASHEIVRSAPWFWTRNNLVANNGGSAATEYSIAWALQGNGVLLHPEGKVHWTSDTIQPLFGGVAEMATEAARRARADGRRVFIVPIVWKLCYMEDITRALAAEMKLIECALSLDEGHGLRLADRFLVLQERLLARQMQRFGFDASAVRSLDFFARQDAFRQWLVSDLRSRHVVEPGPTIERTIHRLGRVIAAKRRTAPDYAALVADANKVAEAERLGGFNRDTYGTERLSQEQIAESLKRIRASMMKTGLRNVLHNTLPRPYGDRVVHVRVPEPIPIDGVKASGDEGERRAYVASLIDRLHTRMQFKLDAINAELHDSVAKWSHPNPFLDGGPSA